MTASVISAVNRHWLGRVEYGAALELQERLRAAVCSGEESEQLLLLEHEPVYTIGRRRDQSSLLAPERLPHPIFEINRGGQATYHGPGQLIGYPILNLARRGRDLHRYLRLLERAVIELLAQHRVQARQREKFTGVWVENRKIASIGVGLRNWITMHGFALNVAGDLSGFNAIVPCGIAGVQMTSLERETQSQADVKQVALDFAEIFTEMLENELPRL